MKNKLKIFMLFFITALLVYDVSGIIIGGKYYPDVSNVVVSLLNYGDNNELTPGTIEEFKIKIENIATVASEDVSIEIVNSFPIDPTKTGNEITEIGNLKAYQDGDEAVIKTFRAFVSEEATTGSYDLVLRVYLKDKLSYEKKYSINVKIPTSTISLKNVVINPEIVVPGSDFLLEFTLENSDDSIVRNLNLKVDLSSQELPFSVMETGSEIRLNSINSNSKVDIDFKIISFNNAKPGYYKIPLIIEYEDEKGAKYIKNELIPVILGDESKLSYFVDKDDSYKFNLKSRISINLINRGLTEIKFIEVEVDEEKLKSQGISLSSSNRYYVGNLDSDEATSADFSVIIKDLNSLNTVENQKEEINFKIPVKIIYSDFTNTEKVIEDSLDLNLNRNNMIIGASNSGGSTFTFVIVVLLIIGVVVFLKNKKKKKKYN